VDREASAELELFVRQRMSGLLRFGLALAGSNDDGADLVQEALEQTGRRWRTLRNRENPEGYVRRVMVTRYISRWRKRGREVLCAEVPDSAGPLGADFDPAVWAALATLPPRQRTVLVLRYYEDLPETEIARLINCSVGTVKSQSFKARSKMRALLGAQRVEEGERRHAR
jgi:RNA polymerase sigma-70 factor (sigma-E family)